MSIKKLVEDQGDASRPPRKSLEEMRKREDEEEEEEVEPEEGRRQQNRSSRTKRQTICMMKSHASCVLETLEDVGDVTV